MEANELLKKIRKIEIKTRGLSQNIFAGEYHSAFKGRGMIFSEVREYQPGDDIRDIDWNVTARHNKPYVKVYEEERELTVMLLVDVSGSRNFGACGEIKKERMAEIAATLAFSSIQNNDKVGVIFFSDKIEKFIPPKKGKKHILLIIREIINFEPESSGTNIDVALQFMTNAIKKRCSAFLISDFIDDHDYFKVCRSQTESMILRQYRYMTDAMQKCRMWVLSVSGILNEAQTVGSTPLHRLRGRLMPRHGMSVSNVSRLLPPAVVLILHP